jgi:hypothetical protein
MDKIIGFMVAIIILMVAFAGVVWFLGLFDPTLSP